MAGKITDAGGLLLLDVLFGSAAKIVSFTIALFTDANAVTDSDTNVTHTIITNGDAGYADETFINNAAFAVNSGIPEAVWGEVSWVFTGALTGNASVTGYQVLSGTTVLWGETLAVAFTPAVNGDTLKIIPKYRLGNGVAV